MIKFVWFPLVAMASAATAQQAPAPGDAPRGPGGGGTGMFRMADANGDGVVTREEYLVGVDARFARMDANGDGVLQASERPMRGMMRPSSGANSGAPPAGAAGGMGAAGPAQIGGDMTREQYRTAALRRFDRVDANGDGKVDAAEMQAGALLNRFNGAGARSSGAAATPPPAQ